MRSIFSTVLTGLLAGFLFVFASCVGDPLGESTDVVRVGDKVPAFTVRSADGTVYEGGASRGRVRVLVFFNTSCGDCRAFLPVVEAFHRQRLQEAGVARTELLCIARAQDAVSVADYWASQGFHMPYAPQEDRKVYALFARSGIPRVYIVSPHGRISAIYREGGLPTVEELGAAVRRAAE